MIKNKEEAGSTSEQLKNDATPAKANTQVAAAIDAKLSEKKKAYWAKRRGATPEQDGTPPVLVQTASTPTDGLEPLTRSSIDEELRPEANQADIKLGPAEVPPIGVGETVSSPVDGPARPQPAAKASVPFMITEATQAKLRDLGLSQGTIDKMTPAEAHAILKATSGMTSKEAKVSDNLAGDAGVSTLESKPAGAADDSVPQEIPAKPVSPKTLKANRENSKRSTGPTSEAGKQRSSQNSYKHGFFARRLFPTPQQWAEDGKDYRALAVTVHEHYQPIGPWEMFWAEKIVTEALRHARSIGYQQPVLGSDYRFWGTQLNTAQRHETAAFKHMLQAVKMLESIQEVRKANSSLAQPITSDREPVSEASSGRATVTPESSETEVGCADKTEQQADSRGSTDVVDVAATDDEQDGSGFLYQGPPDRGAVSSNEQGPEAGSTRQSTSVRGTNPDSPQSQPDEGDVREAANMPKNSLADIVARSIERDRLSTSEAIPIVFRAQNVGTNPNSVPAKEPTQTDFKEDSE